MEWKLAGPVCPGRWHRTAVFDRQLKHYLSTNELTVQRFALLNLDLADVIEALRPLDGKEAEWMVELYAMGDELSLSVHAIQLTEMPFFSPPST